jgi:hypothetical protein
MKRNPDPPAAAFHLDHDLRAYFRTVVEETLEHHASRPDPLVQEYLLGLLEDAGSTPEAIALAVDRPLGVQLAEALGSHPAARFERLRQVGDGVLLIGGLYRGYLERRGLEDGYVVAVGRRAYGAAAALLEAPALTGEKIGGQGILTDLAYGFRDLMSLLRDVALTLAARAAHSAQDLARLCEIWLSERSEHLARLLRARGVAVSHVPAEPLLVLSN